MSFLIPKDYLSWQFVQAGKRVEPQYLPVACRNHNIIVVIKFILSLSQQICHWQLQEATVVKTKNVWFNTLKLMRAWENARRFFSSHLEVILGLVSLLNEPSNQVQPLLLLHLHYLNVHCPFTFCP